MSDPRTVNQEGKEMMNDSNLRCTVCGRKSTTSFASSLRNGWEKCCGYTMRLETTTADIDKAVGSAIGSQIPASLSDGSDG